MISRPLALFASLLLSGCFAVGPDYQRPKIPIPRQWTETPAVQGSQPDKWWKTFNDPILDKLISDAIASNLDLKLALARVKDARALRSATIAAGLPSLDAKSSVSRRFNNSSSPASQTGTSSAGGGFGIGNQFINIFQMGFDAQWELDFFGGVRRAVESADATIDVEVENSRDVLVTLLGEVARNYIELRANQRLVTITRENLHAQQETRELTQIRQQTGLASMLEVTQAQAQAATTEAQLPNYETAVKQSIHALSVLLGKEPGALAVRLDQQGTIPAIAANAITNLPSELLQRRPDIRRAERQLAVANASIGVATAELYPKINLAAFIGLQNTTITDFTPIGKSWSAASSLTLPIFNWGKLNANINSKKAQFEQTFLTYQSTVLSAFKEVEDALIAYSKEQQRHKALAKAVAANQLAVQLANERYQKGLTAFLDVLTSQTALYQAQSLLVTSESQLSSNLVALYKALGGGWQTEAIVGDVEK
ncbi:efflux transporter outer membrane subunit [Methylobacter sp.]|uniref:efflux transporter outer membrane subunit n=1 Tax=Methylobacter sp. TaxID=2051955 RepID=UPI002487CCCA|nr:efflux transporter outer membrane subunit [Methylobacter sp.]MDI1276087.1 efflux transporter outer membrane subunit [Methylobacter sp.]MDI1356843.1 efflux transporter outer membrane subunit [Methylobacter sp.]